MNNQYKIAFSISFVLAMLFVLPWLSLFEYAETLRAGIPEGRIKGRIIALWFTTFASAMAFFQFNFFGKRFIPISRNRMIERGMIMLINLSLVILISLLLMAFVKRAFQMDVNKVFFVIYLLRNLVIAFVCVLVVYAYEVSQHAKDNKMKLMSISRQKAETDLEILKNQLDPHFLFNSLNSLSGVIRNDQKEALRFVEHLSETFRYTLEKRSEHMVSLKDEIHFLESYLYMMQMRFGAGLRVSMEIQPEDVNRKLPQYALQLLLENAIKHNVVSVKKPLEVFIRTHGKNLVVANKLQPRDASIRGHGIGLANLRKRYELLGYHSVEISKSDTDFEVILALV